MHNAIHQSDDGMETDHKFRNKLDNRRDRLRSATRAQNMYNKSVQKNNRLGVKGISERWGSYIARLTVDNVTLSLGTFPTLELAVEARRAEEVKYHGDFRSEAA